MNIILLVFLFTDVYVYANTRHGDLSDVAHHIDAAHHDLKYDQEAFVGKDEAKEFSKLTPVESKNRLRDLVVNKVDTNKDGKVDKKELKEWISKVSKTWQLAERDRAWLDYNPDNKVKLDFQTYSTVNYGDEIDKRYSGSELKRVLKEIEFDKTKWQLADENNDGVLDKQEFFAFVRPEEVSKMKPFLIDELLSKADKNGDGYLDKNEYSDELYTREPELVRGRDKEPEWITSELNHFGKHRDVNNDGKMDRHEMGDWIMPENYDGIEAEVMHLISSSDQDSDEKLSIDEIVDNNDLFAGSQFTYYGNVVDKEEL